MLLRVQRRRTKGWRMPPNTVYVGRPTRWGNPFPVDGEWAWWAAMIVGVDPDVPRNRRWLAASLYSAWLRGEFSRLGSVARYARMFLALPARPPDVGELRGHNLACWCPVGEPCHAITLLELANA